MSSKSVIRAVARMTRVSANETDPSQSLQVIAIYVKARRNRQKTAWQYASAAGAARRSGVPRPIRHDLCRFSATLPRRRCAAARSKTQRDKRCCASKTRKDSCARKRQRKQQKSASDHWSPMPCQRALRCYAMPPIQAIARLALPRRCRHIAPALAAPQSAAHVTAHKAASQR